MTIVSSSDNIQISESAGNRASKFLMHFEEFLIHDWPVQTDQKLPAFQNQGLTKTKNGWTFNFEWDALQPQRSRSPSARAEGTLERK
jgi:hypothetical protein